MTSSVGSAGAGFSDYFGLNDLVTGTNASDIAVRSDILSRNGGAADGDARHLGHAHDWKLGAVTGLGDRR